MVYKDVTESIPQIVLKLLEISTFAVHHYGNTSTNGGTLDDRVG